MILRQTADITLHRTSPFGKRVLLGDMMVFWWENSLALPFHWGIGSVAHASWRRTLTPMPLIMRLRQQKFEMSVWRIDCSIFGIFECLSHTLFCISFAIIYDKRYKVGIHSMPGTSHYFAHFLFNWIIKVVQLEFNDNFDLCQTIYSPTLGLSNRIVEKYIFEILVNSSIQNSWCLFISF